MFLTCRAFTDHLGDFYRLVDLIVVFRLSHDAQLIRFILNKWHQAEHSSGRKSYYGGFSCPNDQIQE